MSGKDDVKHWVKEFLDHVNDLHVDAIETFQTRRHRVASRWNNGIRDTGPNGKPIAMTGTAVWTVDEGARATAWLDRAGLVFTLAANSGDRFAQVGG